MTQAKLITAAREAMDDIIAAVRRKESLMGHWWADCNPPMWGEKETWAEQDVPTREEVEKRHREFIDSLTPEQFRAMKEAQAADQAVEIFSPEERQARMEHFYALIGDARKQELLDIIADRIKSLMPLFAEGMQQKYEQKLALQGITLEEDERKYRSYAQCPMRESHLPMYDMLLAITKRASEQYGAYFPHNEAPFQCFNKPLPENGNEDTPRRWVVLPNIPKAEHHLPHVDFDAFRRMFEEKTLPELQDPANWQRFKLPNGTALTVSQDERKPRSMVFSVAADMDYRKTFGPAVRQSYEIDGAVVDATHYLRATAHLDKALIYYPPEWGIEDDQHFTNRIHFIGPEGAKLVQDYFGVDTHKIKDAPQRGR